MTAASVLWNGHCFYLGKQQFTRIPEIMKLKFCTTITLEFVKKVNFLTEEQCFVQFVLRIAEF